MTTSDDGSRSTFPFVRQELNLGNCSTRPVTPSDWTRRGVLTDSVAAALDEERPRRCAGATNLFVLVTPQAARPGWPGGAPI